MDERRRIVGGMIIYTSTTYLSQAINVLRNLAIARYLEPLGLSILGKAQLLFDYSQFTNLGATFAFDVRYPLLVGEGKRHAAVSLRATALLLNIVVASR